MLSPASESTTIQFPFCPLPDLTILYDPSDPPPPPVSSFHTPYSRRLASLGHSKKARRADCESSLYRYLRGDSNSPWREHISNSMLRTMPFHAETIARTQYQKYRSLESFIESEFCKMEFRLSTRDITESESILRKLRAQISAILPKSADKIGCTPDSRFKLKLFHTSSPSLESIKRLQSLLPKSVTLTYSVYPKSDFRAEFKSFWSPDLPSDDIRRADLEVLLDGLQLSKLHGFTRPDRSNFVYTSEYTKLPTSTTAKLPTVLSKSGKKIPRHPVTGELATHMSRIVTDRTTADDLLISDWVLIE